MHALTVTHAFGTCLEEIWIHNILIFIANKKKKKKGKNCQIIFIYLFFLNFFFFFSKRISNTHAHAYILGFMSSYIGMDK
jgi:hypothetical protein